MEDSDTLFVGAKYTAGCFLEQWALVEKATSIHSHFKHVFQQPNKAEVFKTLVKSYQNNYKIYIELSSMSFEGVESSR